MIQRKLFLERIKDSQKLIDILNLIEDDSDFVTVYFTLNKLYEMPEKMRVKFENIANPELIAAMLNTEPNSAFHDIFNISEIIEEKDVKQTIDIFKKGAIYAMVEPYAQSGNIDELYGIVNRLYGYGIEISFNTVIKFYNIFEPLFGSGYNNVIAISKILKLCKYNDYLVKNIDTLLRVIKAVPDQYKEDDLFLSKVANYVQDNIDIKTIVSLAIVDIS